MVAQVLRLSESEMAQKSPREGPLLQPLQAWPSLQARLISSVRQADAARRPRRSPPPWRTRQDRRLTPRPPRVPTLQVTGRGERARLTRCRRRGGIDRAVSPEAIEIPAVSPRGRSPCQRSEGRGRRAQAYRGLCPPPPANRSQLPPFTWNQHYGEIGPSGSPQSANGRIRSSCMVPRST